MLNYKKPLLLLGQGAKGSRYLEYAEKYQIPILTSRLGIDLVEYDHPLYIGHPGNYGTKPAWLALKEADLIFVAGSRLASAVVGYKPEEWGKNAHKIVVDIDGQELIKPGIKIDTPINTDCKRFFDELLEVTKDEPKVIHKRWIKQCQLWKKKYPVVTNKMKKTLNSYYFTEKLSQAAKAKDIIMVDTGSCFHVVTQTWKIKKGQRFLTTGGLSSMGWWAAALGGAVLGNTIMITGDGSLQMNLQELATMKHYKLPIKLVVFNNDGYGLIRMTQRRFKLNHIGESPKTGLWCPDLKRIAEAYRIKFYRISSLSNLDEGIKKTLDFIGPVILEVMTPKWQEFIREDEQKTCPDNH